MWERETVEIDGATIDYRCQGLGSPIVFVHGVYVGGSLWDGVVERIDGHRCIVPTWPLGAHSTPAPGTDLSARATAARIPAFIDALGLDDVTLVGNDTGGGLCLAALATGHPGLERVARLVLTDCDSYEHFPPAGFDKLVGLTRRVPRAGAALIRAIASGPGRRFFLKAVCTQPPSGPAADRLFEAFPTSKAARRDALRVTQSLEPSVTLDAVDALRAFTKPVLLAWGDSDKFFPLAHAERLGADFPDAQLTTIANASTFVMIDQPDALATAIVAFIEEPTP